MMITHASNRLYSAHYRERTFTLESFRSLVTLLLLVTPIASAFSAVRSSWSLPGLRSSTQSTCSYESSGLSWITNNGSSRSRHVCLEHLAGTRLQYSDGDNHEGIASHGSEHHHGWWNQFFALPLGNDSQEDPQQAIVDDYLDFLDRRYHRLHEDEERRDQKFSAWKWLMQAPNHETLESEEVATSEDALFVLGVAGLASERLLKKRQFPPGNDEEDTITSVDVSASSTTPSHVILSGATSNIAPPRAVERVRLVAVSQLRMLKRALSLAFRLITNAPSKAFNLLLEFGGGKKTLTMTLYFAAALCFHLVRPLLHVMVSQRA